MTTEGAAVGMNNTICDEQHQWKSIASENNEITENKKSRTLYYKNYYQRRKNRQMSEADIAREKLIQIEVQVEDVFTKIHQLRSKTEGIILFLYRRSQAEQEKARGNGWNCDLGLFNPDARQQNQ